MFDFHTHTTYSDGKSSPAELLSAARNAKLTHIAFTDHDNDFAFKEVAAMMGLQQSRHICLGELTLVNGVELSCRWENMDIHLLALNYPSGAQTMESLLARQANTRAERNLKIRESLRACGIDLEFVELETRVSCERAGRAYFADKLVQAGLVKNAQRAFKRYLGKSGRAYVKASWPELPEVVRCINEADGTAVLAHPLKYKMSRGKLARLFQEFALAGGQACEAISGKQVNTETERVLRLAETNALKLSLGSDFHQTGRPWAALGVAGSLPRHSAPVWQDWANI